MKRTMMKGELCNLKKGGLEKKLADKKENQKKNRAKLNLKPEKNQEKEKDVKEKINEKKVGAKNKARHDKTSEKTGPKPKYTEWITAHGLTLITGWARNGLTGQEISKNIGIHPATLCVWQKEHPEIDKALKSGREVSDLAVENALFNKAIRGDVGAICFYLKNRRPDKWRDKPNAPNDQMLVDIEIARAQIALEKEQLELRLMRSMQGEGDAENAYAQIRSIVDMINNPVPDRTIDDILECADELASDTSSSLDSHESHQEEGNEENDNNGGDSE